ncbi:M15 family metallopeptidase [Flavicella sediminum]|uniref:M15 family metallopeptidase n=1 Tax=Flavicella sediminum TaxID=2585141 RepID=UPI0011210053|nr:M15 family metallopeptidase [Flavicella sediminum]
MKKWFFRVTCCFWLTTIFGQNVERPADFKSVAEEIPSIVLDIRYQGAHNFVGRPIEGYEKPIAYLSNQAMEQLHKVQQTLQELGMGLKLYDAYRPQRAVDYFVKWATMESDTLMKQEFYPNVQKKNLFKLGYIARKSGHSRGSSLDLTIIELSSGKELDMGSPYDLFDKIAWPDAAAISEKQKANRMLLREVMLENNFKSYQYEWWHFTLHNEPYPNTYFDFLVE